MTPIVIATKGSKSINVLLESIHQYVPRETIVYVCGNSETMPCWEWIKWLGDNDRNTFGESYNYAITQAFLDGHETVIVANDDVVLDPNTYWLLTHDRVLLKQQGHKVGFVSARSNMATMPQNIRAKQENDQWTGMKLASEDTIAQV